MNLAGMISYVLGTVVVGWLLCGMPGRAHLVSRLFQSLGCFRTFRFWVLLALLGVPLGYVIVLLLAFLWAGRWLWGRGRKAPVVVEAEGIGISSCE